MINFGHDCYAVTPMNNEVYVLYNDEQQHDLINVYEHNNLQTAKKTKQLPATVTSTWNLVHAA